MTPAIEIEGLRKRYGRNHPWAVDGIDIRVEQGSVFGCLGPNGAGKTSIVKMVAGLSRPDAGTVRILGRAPGEAGARVALGFAPENPDFPKFLCATEVLDYFGRLLGLSAADRAVRITEALSWAGLEAEHRQIRHFSKGMKQRLGLAQAILNRPRLLILDEPTADLDPLGRLAVRELIVKLKGAGTTVFLNSHLLSEVERVSDTVAIVVHGRVVKEGTMAEVVPEGQSLEEAFVELVGAGSTNEPPAFISGPWIGQVQS